MNRRFFQAWAWAALAVLTALAGCETMPSLLQRAPEKPATAQPAQTPVQPAVQLAAQPAAQPPAPPPAPPAPSPTLLAAQRDLAEGIELYDRGEYNAAIHKLGTSHDISTASVEIKTAALKYLAFSFCLTRRQTQCRTQFETAFKLDPAFDLAPAELGHPLWGPVFARVKKAHETAPK